MRQSTAHTPAWQAHAPAPHSKLPPRQSRVHIDPPHDGASAAATHEVGWQHCAGTQSASERQAVPAAAEALGAGGGSAAGDAEGGSPEARAGMATVS